MGSKLISIGCSYTDHNCFPNVKYWDVHLAEYLNLELHNYARGGAGGDMHLSMLTDAIAEHGDSIDTVAIGWSQWFRYSFPYLNGPERYNPPTVNTYEHEHQKTVWTWLKNKAPGLFWNSIIGSAYSQMYIATKLVDSIGAKLIFTQMLNPFSMGKLRDDCFDAEKKYYQYNYLNILYDVTEGNPIYQSLAKDKRLLGFPFIEMLGGTYITAPPGFKFPEYVLGHEVKKQKFIFNKEGMAETVDFIEIDGHPNDKGHEFIFEKVKTHYENLYG